MKHVCKWHVNEKPWQNKGLRIQESSYLARWLKEKFEWSYLLCMECDEHFLLFYPPSHVLKRSAASSRFAMHSSYEEVVSGVESPFGLLKPYLHDSMIARSIQTLSVNQFVQWQMPSPLSSPRKEIQLKVTYCIFWPRNTSVKCKSCIGQNELLLKPQKIKILRIIIMLWNLQSRKMNSIKRSGFGMSIKSYFLSLLNHYCSPH